MKVLERVKRNSVCLHDWQGDHFHHATSTRKEEEAVICFCGFVAHPYMYGIVYRGLHCS